MAHQPKEQSRGDTSLGQLWDVCYPSMRGKEQRVMTNASTSIRSPQSQKDLPNSSCVHNFPQKQARRCQKCPRRGLGFGHPAADGAPSQVTRTQLGRRQGSVSDSSSCAGEEAHGSAWLLARSHVPRDEVPTSKMSSKEKTSPPGPCAWQTAARRVSLRHQTLCRGRLGREGTSPWCCASFTRMMMPNKVGRCGLTDGGGMRDEQRHGPTAASNQAITGGFTPALSRPGAQRPPAALTGMNGRAARPGWGRRWVPRDTETEQGKRQLWEGDEGENNADPGGRWVLVREKGPFCRRRCSRSCGAGGDLL